MQIYIWFYISSLIKITIRKSWNTFKIWKVKTKRITYIHTFFRLLSKYNQRDKSKCNFPECWYSTHCWSNHWQPNQYIHYYLQEQNIRFHKINISCLDLSFLLYLNFQYKKVGIILIKSNDYFSEYYVLLLQDGKKL